MGIGVDKSVYDWIVANVSADYFAEIFLEEDGGYYWFSELPDSLTFDEDTGAVYTVSTRPSQEGIFIGNLV